MVSQEFSCICHDFPRKKRWLWFHWSEWLFSSCAQNAYYVVVVFKAGGHGAPRLHIFICMHISFMGIGRKRHLIAGPRVGALAMNQLIAKAMAHHLSNGIFLSLALGKARVRIHSNIVWQLPVTAGVSLFLFLDWKAIWNEKPGPLIGI